jgi:hypothetical protein
VTPRAAGELDARGGRVVAQGREDPLGDPQRAGQQQPGPRRAVRSRRERGEHRLLELRPEAADLAQPLRRTRAAQLVDRADPELVEQPPRALRPDPRQARDRHEAGRVLRAQLLGGRDRPRLEHRGDLLGDRLADPSQLLGAPLAREVGDGDARLADRLRRAPVGGDAVDDGPVELVQVRQLVEVGG